jgi:hypothetical protein
VNRRLTRWLILILVLANLALYYWLRTETRQIVETVPVGIKRLVLLEELSPKTCWLAGPLDQAAVREAVTDALDARGIQLNLILQRATVEPDFWVHLPVDGGAQQQRLLAAELSQKGIDSFSITEGRLSGDLSLGLFRNEEHARTLMSKIRQRGYAPELYERSRSREEAWAALDQAELAALGWAAEAGPLAAYPSVNLIQQDCPD